MNSISLSLNSFTFFIKKAQQIQSQMENDFLTDDFDGVIEKKKQFDFLISRAMQEKVLVNKEIK